MSIDLKHLLDWGIPNTQRNSTHPYAVDQAAVSARYRALEECWRQEFSPAQRKALQQARWHIEMSEAISRLEEAIGARDWQHADWTLKQLKDT
jgi:hypothetical protein